MNQLFDRRLTPARPDLAAEKLRGLVKADRFVSGVRHRIFAPSTPLKREPYPDAAYETEALAGETITIYDETEGWAWGQLETDGYVGWLSALALGPLDPAPTHRVISLRTFLYPGPSIKAEPLGALSLGATVALTRVEGNFFATPAGFIFGGHLAPIRVFEKDYVAVAERFIGVPYLWGGKTSLGLDCSGLVQIAMAAAGVSAPRDSDMLAVQQGDLLPTETSGLQRGDLIFWNGHVGIMQDRVQLLHANGHHMMVVSEPLEEAISRILANSYGAVTAIRRP